MWNKSIRGSVCLGRWTDFFLKIWLFENKYVTLHHRCNNRNLHLRSVPTFWVRISSFIDRSSTNIPQKVKEMM
nr:MAG TPA: hypothetical protein [Caudoviricetes sp.]